MRVSAVKSGSRQSHGQDEGKGSARAQSSPAHQLAASYYTVSLLLGVLQAPVREGQDDSTNDLSWTDIPKLSIACATEVSVLSELCS